LKLAQVASREQSSEQCSSEDEEIVLFALSNAHIAGPFFTFLDILNDTTLTVSRFADIAIIMAPISSSSSCCSIIETVIFFIFSLIIYSPVEQGCEYNV